MGLRRVGHDWATSLSVFTFMRWRRKWQPAPMFLPGESQGRGSLVGCHLWGHTESDTAAAAAAKMVALTLNKKTKLNWVCWSKEKVYKLCCILRKREGPESEPLWPGHPLLLCALGKVTIQYIVWAGALLKVKRGSSLIHHDTGISWDWPRANQGALSLYPQGTWYHTR